jgi:hypothetical protein
MSEAMSAGVRGWNTASGAAVTIWPKSVDALAVALRSVRSLDVMPRLKRSLGRPEAGDGRSWPATTVRKLVRRASAAKRLLAMLLFDANNELAMKY